jgi:hypothetical protein
MIGKFWWRTLLRTDKIKSPILVPAACAGTRGPLTQREELEESIQGTVVWG